MLGLRCGSVNMLSPDVRFWWGSRMTGRAHLQVIVTNEAFAQSGAGADQKSCSRILDPYWLRVNLPGLWSDYLRARFDRIEDVATYFGVAFQTACTWWRGEGRPSADKLLMAWLSDRDGFEAAFGPRAVMRRAA